MSGRIKGLTIEIDGKTTKLQKALTEVESKTRTMKTGLRDVDRLLRFDPKNTELLRQKQDMLNKALTSSKEKLTKLNQAMEQMKKSDGFDENSEDAQRLKREIIATEQEIARLETSMKQFGSVGRQQLAAVGQHMRDIGDKVIATGQKMSAFGTQMTQKLTLPIALAAGAAVKSFAEVDKTMTLTNQTMGNTESEAKALSDAMKDAAANSTFGMNDAAQASLNFARAGLDAAQAADTLAPAMNLAAGEGGDLNQVSAGLVATINGFHGAFKDASKYADVFANACNNSALDIDGLSSAMSVAAPIFASAGYSVNDAALYMGVMANAGIDANKSANSLKTGLARLVAPSKEGAEWLDKLGISLTDQSGMMKDTVTVQGELHDAFAQLSEAEQIAAASAIFGKNQMAPWLALINTAPDQVGALNDQLKMTGTTSEMAEAMMSGFGGSLEKLKSSIDVAKTSFGEALAPVISKIADKIQAAVDKFNSLSDAEKENIAKTTLLVAAAGPALTIVGKLTSGVGHLVGGIGDVIKKVALWSEGMGLLSAGPAAGLILAIGGLVGGAYAYSKHLQKAVEDTYAFTKAEQDNMNQIDKATQSYNEAIKARDDSVQSLSAEYGYIEQLKEEYNSLIDSNGQVKAGYEARADFILGTLSESLGIEKGKILELRDANGLLTGSIDQVIEKKKAQAFLDANYDSYQEAIKLQTENTQALAEAMQSLTEREQVAAQQKQIYNDMQAQANAITAEGGRVSGEMSAKIRAAYDEYQIASGKVSELKGKIKEYQDASVNASQTISNYEKLSTAATQENYTEMNAIFKRMEFGLKAHGNATSDELKKQAEQARKDYETLRQAYNNHEKGITEDMVKWAEDRSKQADTEAGIMRDKMGKAGSDQGAAYSAALEKKAGAADKAGADVKEAAIKAITDFKNRFFSKGSDGGSSYASGIGKGGVPTADNARALRDAAITNADTGNEGSRLGSNFGSGFASGIGGWLRSVGSIAASLATTAIASLQSAQRSNSPSKVTKKLGRDFGQGYGIGIKEETGKIAGIAGSMTRAAIAAASTPAYANPLTFMNAGATGSGAQAAGKSVIQNNTITFNVTGENPAAIVEQLATELNMMARMA